MLIKKAKYKKAKRIVKEKISDNVFGCDYCKKSILEQEKLDISVFYENKKLIKNKQGDDTDDHEFCSWKCVVSFLPKIKTDYFIRLPYLHYYKTSEGQGIQDFLKLLKNVKK